MANQRWSVVQTINGAGEKKSHLRTHAVTLTHMVLITLFIAPGMITNLKFRNNTERNKSLKLCSDLKRDLREEVGDASDGGMRDEFVLLSYIIQMRHLYLNL